MILVCEAAHSGLPHARFNAGLLDAICRATPGEVVHFLATATHAGAVSQYWRDHGIVHPEVDVRTIDPAWVGQRSLGTLRLGALLLQMAGSRDGGRSVIVFSGITVRGMLVMRVLAAASRFEGTLAFALHGILEAAVRGWRPASRPVLSAILEGCASPCGEGGARTVVVLFNRAVLAAAEEALGFVVGGRARFVSVSPPYVLEGRDARLEQQPSRPGVVFGWIGRPSRGKFELFLELARRTKSRHPHARFVLVGPRELPFAAGTDGLVECSSSCELLPKEEYEALLNEVTVAVSFGNEEQYTLGISASTLECLERRIPLIMMKGSFADHVSSWLGEVGLVCDDFEAVCRMVDQLCRTGNAEVSGEIRGAMEAARVRVSASAVAPALWSAIIGETS